MHLNFISSIQYFWIQNLSSKFTIKSKTRFTKWYLYFIKNRFIVYQLPLLFMNVVVKKGLAQGFETRYLTFISIFYLCTF